MQAATATPNGRIWNNYVIAALVVALACLRFCHVNLLWADEDYHLSAAINILHGRIPYRDFWYDKPPLCAVYYLLNAGYPGWPLRLLDAAYIVVACWIAYRIAREWWSEVEGRVAALLLAFFTTFYLPSAVIPFAADALMLVPHLAAIYCASRKRPVVAGIWCGVAFLFNAKGIFVLAVCIVWLLPETALLLLGFSVPVAAGFTTALATGAWPGYLEQVWRWGLIYAQGSPVTDPVTLGIRRTADWLGFHGAVTVAAIYAYVYISGRERWKLLVWAVISFGAVCLGTRFAPHYFLQLLPALVIPASRGILLARRRYRNAAPVLLTLLLLVPFIRFGPRYVTLAISDVMHRQPQWTDIILDVDSRFVADNIRALSRPGDTLFVWGYRPDIYVYTRMVPDGLFCDSQPLTGVPADRHLRVDTPIYNAPAAANRRVLARSQPTFIADGLGLLNPKLAPTVYPDLREWLANYHLVARTNLTLIYKRRK